MDFPQQVANVSYGVAAQETVFVNANSSATYLIPINDALDPVWTTNGFAAMDNGFADGSAAMGFDADADSPSSFVNEIITALPPRTHGVYARIEFDVGDVSAIDRLT